MPLVVFYSGPQFARTISISLKRQYPNFHSELKADMSSVNASLNNTHLRCYFAHFWEPSSVSWMKHSQKCDGVFAVRAHTSVLHIQEQE